MNASAVDSVDAFLFVSINKGRTHRLMRFCLSGTYKHKANT
jgi:hypothetical protein